MDEAIAREFTASQRIHVEQIAREWWEMALLKDIFDSEFGSGLVFKGGTALRFAYGSPRFSEDLDFSVIKGVSFSAFEKIIKGAEKKFNELRIKDLCQKYNTIIAEYSVKEQWLERAFSIKIEISKRIRRVKYESILLSSSVSNLQVVGNVYTLEQILKEKKEALAARKKPRDIFDIWYIGQKLKTYAALPAHDIPSKELTQELRKYLPTDYWKVIPSLSTRKK